MDEKQEVTETQIEVGIALTLNTRLAHQLPL